MLKVDFKIKLILLLCFGCFPPLVAQANLLFVVPSISFKEKVIPLPDHDNTFFILKVLGENLEDKSNRFSYNFTSAKSRLSSRFPLFGNPLRLRVIPYKSIADSVYYKPLDKLNRQPSIAEFCNNYFPISKGELFYELALFDEKRNFNLPHYDYFSSSRYYKVESNQSVYVEVDIKNDSYTYKIIETPSDIFSDMCK